MDQKEKKWIKSEKMDQKFDVIGSHSNECGAKRVENQFC